MPDGGCWNPNIESSVPQCSLMRVSEAEFRSQLQSLTREALTAFLRDLWRRRGWETNGTDDGLRVQKPETDGETVIRPMMPGDGAGRGQADIVVAVTQIDDGDVPAGTSVMDPSDLYEMLRFAVEPPVGNALVADHFDVPKPDQSGTSTERAAAGADPTTGPAAQTRPRPLDGESEPAECPRSPLEGSGNRADSENGTGQGGQGSNAPTAPGGLEPAESTRETGIDGDGAQRWDETGAGHRNRDSPDGAWQTEAANGSGDATPGTVPGNDTDDGEDHSVSTTRRSVLVGGTAVLGGLGTLAGSLLLRDGNLTGAPGITAAGIADPAALASAHTAVLDSHSYSLAADRVTNRADGSLRSYLSMDLSLSLERQYHTLVATAGPAAPKFLGNPPAAAEYWSDGELYLVNPDRAGATPNTFEPYGVAGRWRYWAHVIPYGGRYPSRPTDFYQILFEGIPTVLDARNRRDGSTFYRIASDGSGPRSPTALEEIYVPTVASLSLDAVVEHNGLIRSLVLSLSGTLDNERVSISRRIEHTGIGETTVQRPEWYERAVE